MKKFGWLILFGAISVGGLINPVQAQSSQEADDTDMVDLQNLACRELLRAEGEQRGNLMIFMHGFMSGKKGEMTIDAPTLAEASNTIIETCIDNPDSKLMNVFEQNR